MVIVLYTLLLLGCSTVLSVVAFLVGRYGRKLPIDDMLPRVLHTARFEPEDDRPRSLPGGSGPKWPHAS